MHRETRPISLRAILATAMTAMGVSALIAALSLVVIAAYMHQAVALVTAATESVHTAQEMEVDLLVHNRLTQALPRAQLEGQLRGWLIEMHQYINLLEEERLYEEVARTLRAYLADHDRAIQAGLSHEQIMRETGVELEAAFVALEALVDQNVMEARATAARAETWDRNATFIGLGIGVLLVLVVGAVLVWLRFFAFRSVLQLESSMRAFARGDRSVRAVVDGPRELQDIARGFNEMALALEGQRDRQMAFVAGVVHDLRNPVSVLGLAGALVAPNQPAPDPDAALRALGRVRRQAERLQRMLDDLLDSARIEAGHLELRMAERDLRDIAREVVEMFRDTAQTHDIELDLPAQPLLVRCDPLRIEQVLTNLVSNAIKYSPGARRVHVVLRSQSEHQLVVEVTDQGVGIAEEDLPRIFEPFRRTGASRGQIPGAGMGLFVARRIAEAHGGRVEVQSKLGAGTTFRVWLPALPVQHGRAGLYERVASA